MQALFHISEGTFPKLVEQVFSIGSPTIHLKDSRPGEEARTFRSPQEVVEYAQLLFEPGGNSFGLAIHHPEADGHVLVSRVELNDGTARFSVRGWGLIYLQLSLVPKRSQLIETLLSCHTRGRAEDRFDTYPELQNPDLWNWKAVDRLARKYCRLATQLAEAGA